MGRFNLATDTTASDEICTGTGIFIPIQPNENIETMKECLKITLYNISPAFTNDINKRRSKGAYRRLVFVSRTYSIISGTAPYTDIYNAEDAGLGCPIGAPLLLLMYAMFLECD
ncbi:hypothetical protein Trydic_g49 [Trypoxylus dichotomus]